MLNRTAPANWQRRVSTSYYEYDSQIIQLRESLIETKHLTVVNKVNLYLVAYFCSYLNLFICNIDRGERYLGAF